jgi:hypothetical protein
MQYRVKVVKEPEIYKVRVTDVPKAKTGYQVDGSLANDISAFGGGNLKLGQPSAVARKTITKVPREEANLEAEGGETVLTFDPSGYPLFYEIKGPRHSQNGVPLNLPDDSFIFSDTRSMKISDPNILEMFGKKAKKGGYTPAELSKQYLNINKHRETLQDKDSDKIEIKTAQLMIKKSIFKLGALALAQESKKGFPQGIPVVAKTYMEEAGISEQDILPNAEQPQEGMQQQMPQEGQEPMPQEQMMQGEAPTMPDGSPVAMPEDLSQGQPMPPQEQPTMGYGGIYLRKAKDGAEVTMNKIKERVRMQLETDIPADEIVVSLIKGGVTLEDIQDVFVSLRIPEQQARRFALQGLEKYQQMISAQRQQMQQQQQQAQGMPMVGPQGQGMPPQQMDPRMMQMMAAQQQQMQGPPMGKYGIILGGTNQPLIMANGGYLNTYQKAGPVVVNSGSSSSSSSSKSNLTAEELKAKAKRDNAEKVKKVEEGYVDIGEGYYATGTKEQMAGEKKKYNDYKRTGPYKKQTKQEQENYLNGVCQRMKTGNLQNYTAEELAGKFFDKSFISRMKACETKTGSEKEDIRVVKLEPGEDCPPCIDPKTNKPVVDANGQPVVRTKDPATGECSECTTGEIPPPEKECYCKDPVTGEDIVVECGTNCQEFVKNPEPTPIQNLPEDELNLGIAMAARPVNTPPIMGKSPGVRQQIFGVDYLNEAMLASGMNQGMQKNMAPMLQNNPGGAMAAMFTGNQAAQQNIMGSAARANQFNAGQASAINATNTGWQDKQLMTGLQQADTYNTRKATFDSNVATDNANYWANVGNKNAIMKGNARQLAATNAAQGMKWTIGPGGREYITNTNNKQITPEAPNKTIQQQVADYEAAGYTRDQALRAVGLQNKSTKSVDEAKFGGVIYMGNGGYVYGTNTYPFEY